MQDTCMLQHCLRLHALRKQLLLVSKSPRTRAFTTRAPSTMSVDFGFQADIASTSSLAHLLTGKALKALSDGGVDFYSVAASIWLGKQIPVRPSLESTVHSHIASRGGIQSVLSKALSIGWGHSGLAVEMTRTRAGTSALLLVGALATGSSHFAAAQCLAELLAIGGCEPDKLPNVDVLRRMIAYLAPFVHDLGFSKVLEHVNTAGVRATRKAGSSIGEQHLNSLGDSSALAGGISQLKLTAERDETIFMVTKMRGSWLAAFASHILGMSTELRLGDTVIWASGGERGSVIFQLHSTSLSDTSSQLASKTFRAGISIVEAPVNPDGYDFTDIDYPLGNVLDTVLDQEDKMTEEVRKFVHQVIWRESMNILRDLQHHDGRQARLLGMGLFDNRTALKEALASLGVKSSLIGDIDIEVEQVRLSKAERARWRGLCYATGPELEALEPLYGSSKDALSALISPEEIFGPGYRRLGRIIHGFASTALALMPCSFDPTELRVRHEIVTGEFATRWTEVLLDSTQYNERTSTHAFMRHVHQLLARDESGAVRMNIKDTEHLLGLSGGAYTIYFTGILQDDCYSDIGRYMSIRTGRASLGGVLRSLILEATNFSKTRMTADSVDMSTSLATGSYLEPHYCPSETKVYITTSLGESMIWLQPRIGRTLDHSRPITFSECLLFLMGDWSMPWCSHARGAPYRIPEGLEVAVMGFLPHTDSQMYLKNKISVFALHGNRMEQTLTCGKVWRVFERRVLQLHACLKCCMEIASIGGGPSCIVMAG